ncbi:2-dehydropantoate 2-reductase [Parathalassolituus penaei]|uniref:2-dehydropantoate 2-reductase n=1 Tax=Parathalassolituus penaei TaxID=2997323 RepID=A0A9X3IU11_9GAMM|nr:2-dehydropantoate 2-reductase [Parathalassolituus penaei]MCY0967431.1 2-dehydropantoate 2-reductase [Parathalassolituus penaei]
MNIAIVGAGAIGGHIAARLLHSGQPVSLLARGQTLTQLHQQGLGWSSADSQRQFLPVIASDDAGLLGPQDLVIVAVKEPALAALVPQLRALIGPETRVLTAMNGIPWWFTAGIPALQQQRLSCLDPQGQLADLLPPERILGAVLHMACTNPAPGICHHVMGNRMVLGNACGGVDPTLQKVSELLGQSGFEVQVSDFIHKDIWFKLWGNMTHNPISALTRATTDQIIHDPLTCQLAVRVMTEAQQLGARIGCQLDQDPAARNQEALKLGAFKTSMLQDVEAGKPLEVNALLGAFVELAALLHEDVPWSGSLLGLLRLLANNR